MQLRDRVALVTGGARRIGRAIALRLADGGCHVAIHYHTSAADAEQTAADCRNRGVRALALRADLVDAAATAALPAAVVRQLGRIDVLVNNASIFERMSGEPFSLGAWDRTLRVNLTAPMLLTDAARAELVRNRGAVINLCDAATRHPVAAYAAYHASKAGLETLTKLLARAMAPDVRVVGVAPGVADWPPDYDAALRARLTARIPLGRAGTPEEVAALVHFLLAEGDYITGEVVRIDGGWHTT